MVDSLAHELALERLAGAQAALAAANARLEPDGRYRARTIRMERRLNQQMKDDPPT